MTRKEFITNAAKYAVGVSAGVAGLSVLSPEKTKAEVQEYTWPWPYQKLDAEHVRVLGHDSFWEKACSYAAFKGIIHALAETVGEPASLAACMSCHGAGFQNNVAAKMECVQCHGDPHKPAAVEQLPEMPASFSLEQNYPNPFPQSGSAFADNPGTSIQFSIANTEKVDLAIYGIRGRLVRILVDHELYSPGQYTVSWDGTDNHGQRVASGVYFTKMQAGKYATTRKMSTVKFRTGHRFFIRGNGCPGFRAVFAI